MGAGPTLPPGSTLIVENIANNFDVVAAPLGPPLGPPLIIGSVSALVEGFDDGTFAPSGAVVPLAGNPEAFLAPDSPLPAVVAYYDTLNCLEPFLIDLNGFSLLLTVLIFIMFLVYNSSNFFSGYSLRKFSFVAVFFFLPTSLCFIFFGLYLIGPVDYLMLPPSITEGSEAFLFDPLERSVQNSNTGTWRRYAPWFLGGFAIGGIAYWG